MAPSGAKLLFLGYLLVWLLAARWARAEASVNVTAEPQCRSLSDQFTAALDSRTPQPEVTLGPGCNILSRNFACTPVRSSLLVAGAESSDSIWDTEFDLYQFSVEPGVVLTLRNLVLARTLVFTSVDADLRPTSPDSGLSPGLQLSIFHMRPGSRMVLQDVVIQTRCATLMYYQNKYPGAQQQQQPAGSSSATPPAALVLPNLTLGAVTLVNVTVTCCSGPELSAPADLYVHSAAMLSSFLDATSALSMRATIHVMENLTLPYVASAASSNTESSDMRGGQVMSDTVITGGVPNSSRVAMPYVDANYTAAWLAVQWPAQLTIRQLVLTRLAAGIFAPGGSNGLLAGALPVQMVSVMSSPSPSPAPTQRVFEDVTLLVPQYEVTQITYWSFMFSVGSPEVKPMADFLRPYMRSSEFVVLDSKRLLLQRVRTASSLFVRVLLSSVAPAGVPFDPNAGPPNGAAAYQHVTPPLFFIGSGAEWVDAVAPVLPQDTWPDPPPAAAGAAAAPPQLPALLLIDGSVTLTPSDVRVPGGGMRVARRSVVVTSMHRQGCGSGGGAAANSSCPPAVLDMGELVNAMRLEGLNTTVVFMSITLRNVGSTLNMENAAAVAADQNALDGFFKFDRSSVRLSFESVNMELRGDAFSALYRLIASRPRTGGAGDVGLISMNESLIQLSSFQFGGARGSYVNFTLVPGSGGAVFVQPRSDDSSSGGGGSSNNLVPIVVGSVVGSVGLLLVGLAAFVAVSQLRRRRRGQPWRSRSSKRAAAGAGEEARLRIALSTSKSAGGDLSLQTSGASTSGGGGGAAAAAAMAVAALARACDREKVSGGEESTHCTTLTISDMNSSDTATPLQTVAPLAAAAVVPPLAVANASGQMPRRAFSVAMSVPEHDELGAEISIDSSGRADGISRCSGYSSSAGGVGRRLLMDTTVGGDVAAAVAAAAMAGGMRVSSMILPSLLDQSADTSGRGGGGAAAVSPRSVGGSGGGPSSGASARRMTRMLSGGRPHLYGIGEGGRSVGMRVRAALGRSPSRPGRSPAASSSSGPSATTLTPPQPAVLASMLPSQGPGATAVASASGASLSGSGPRQRGARVAHLYSQQQNHLRNGGGSSGGQRRELSNPMLEGGGAVAAADRGVSVSVVGASVGIELGGEAVASYSAQLMATGGTLDALTGPTYDGDSSSPGASTSISKVPEPASEVQRLIQELATYGTDQLVILEPIGQGGYGTVYRGVWRNLDVAVKTVLFQDRANLTSPQLCCPVSVTTCNQIHTGQTTVIGEDEEGSQKGGAASCPASSSAFPARALASQVHPPPSPLLGATNGAAATTHWGGGSLSGPVNGRDALASGGGGGGGGGGGTHNWALASQQAANSGSLRGVTIGAIGGGGGGGPGGGGPLGPQGVASQQRAVLEAAVSCSVAHPNVVATYHYDITPIRPSGAVCSGGLLVNDGYVRAAAGGGAMGPSGGVPMMMAGANAGISDWKLYLVQEFCDAGSLANALDARAFHDPAGMPNLALTLCALADIARGMAHIHSRSIVHGDLNPTNILLRSIRDSNGGMGPMWNRVALGGGGGGAAYGSVSGSTTPGSSCVGAAANLRQELGVGMVSKVADFGLCGMLAPGKRHISNALRGTPFYTAPETVATGTLTKASDVYSFGVIAWEVYTGRPPFQHVALQGFVRDESFPRLPPHVPATFAKMALACVSADPETRPTFDQILDRLMSLQSKLAVSLQQRLSRLMVSNGAFLGSASPLAAAAAATSTPHSAAIPTAPGYGSGGAGTAATGTVASQSASAEAGGH